MGMGHGYILAMLPVGDFNHPAGDDGAGEGGSEEVDILRTCV